MSENLRVIARFADGRLLKGTTQDFLPNRPQFHLLPADGSPAVEVRCGRLKALFFVRTLEGEPAHEDLRGFLDAPAQTAQGRKVAVQFRDGEFMCGHALSYQPEREGFFLTPVDPAGNNIRVFVIVAATARIKTGPAAEELAAQVLSRVGG